MEQLLNYLYRATHEIGTWIESSLREEGVSHPEAHVVAFVAAHSGCSINDVHRHFGHRRSTLTNLVDRLENRGLLRREVNPASRRSVCLALTHEGRSLAEDVTELIEFLESRVCEQVTADDLRGFKRVAKAIEEAVR